MGVFVYFPRTSKFLFKIKNTAKDAKGKYKNPSESLLLTTYALLNRTALSQTQTSAIVPLNIDIEQILKGMVMISH